MSYADQHTSPILYDDPFNLGKHYPHSTIHSGMRVSDFHHQDFSFHSPTSHDLSSHPRQPSAQVPRVHPHYHQHIFPLQTHSLYPAPPNLQSHSQSLPLAQPQPEQPPQGWSPFASDHTVDSSSFNFDSQTVPLPYAHFSGPSQAPAQHSSPTVTNSTTPSVMTPGQTDSPGTVSQGSTTSRLAGLAGSLDPSTGIFYRTPEHPRLRTAQACEKCRTRKAKCSGEHPSCKRCINRNLVCEYAKEGRVRGPNKSKSKGISTASAVADNSDSVKRTSTSTPTTSTSSSRGKSAQGSSPPAANRGANSTTHLSSTSAAAGARTSSRSAVNSLGNVPNISHSMPHLWFHSVSQGPINRRPETQYGSQVTQMAKGVGPEAAPITKPWLLEPTYPPHPPPRESYIQSHQSYQSVTHGGLAPASHTVTALGRERRGSFSMSARARPRPPNLHLDAVSNQYPASSAQRGHDEDGESGYSMPTQLHQADFYDISQHRQHIRARSVYIPYMQPVLHQQMIHHVPLNNLTLRHRPYIQAEETPSTIPIVPLDGLHGYDSRNSAHPTTSTFSQMSHHAGVVMHSPRPDVNTPYSPNEGHQAQQHNLLIQNNSTFSSNETQSHMQGSGLIMDPSGYDMSLGMQQAQMQTMMSVGMNMDGMDLSFGLPATGRAIANHASAGMTSNTATTPANSASATSLTCPSTSAPSTPIHYHSHQGSPPQQQLQKAPGPISPQGSMSDQTEKSTTTTLSSSPPTAIQNVLPQQPKMSQPGLPLPLPGRGQAFFNTAATHLRRRQSPNQIQLPSIGAQGYIHIRNGSITETTPPGFSSYPQHQGRSTAIIARTKSSPVTGTTIVSPPIPAATTSPIVRIAHPQPSSYITTNPVSKLESVEEDSGANGSVGSGTLPNQEAGKQELRDTDDGGQGTGLHTTPLEPVLVEVRGSGSAPTPVSER